MISNIHAPQAERRAEVHARYLDNPLSDGTEG